MSKPSTRRSLRYLSPWERDKWMPSRSPIVRHPCSLTPPPSSPLTVSGISAPSS
ncbi:hypothetical protein B5X24_HaOG205542 [Helicoverpa armigera]|nr:hypothetical protein B5X24_HaOG205542 [Helicoverpa armigera]